MRAVIWSDEDGEIGGIEATDDGEIGETWSRKVTPLNSIEVPDFLVQNQLRLDAEWKAQRTNLHGLFDVACREIDLSDMERKLLTWAHINKAPYYSRPLDQDESLAVFLDDQMMERRRSEFLGIIGTDDEIEARRGACKHPLEKRSPNHPSLYDREKKTNEPWKLGRMCRMCDLLIPEVKEEL